MKLSAMPAHSTRMEALKLFCIVMVAGWLSGCATMRPPSNLAGAQYQPAQAVDRQDANECHAVRPPLAGGAPIDASFHLAIDTAMPLGPGDRLNLTVAGDPDFLTGTYVVSEDGTLTVEPGLSLVAGGRSVAELERAIRRELVARWLVRALPGNVRLSLGVAAAQPVVVEGAVFDPGQITVGERGPEGSSLVTDHPTRGDVNSQRRLSVALRAAGGVRPDAVIDSIYLERGGRTARIDLSPLLGGVSGAAFDPPLTAGDRIIVPSDGCFHAELVRPTQVTAPGVRVYMSNLARPGNGAPGGVSRDTTGLPYGARLLDGLVGANCVGGSVLNARRSAVLMSRNPINGRAVVISRSVEALVRRADRDDINPYLMPGDSIACYDSAAMAFSDVVNLLGSVAAPAVVVRSLVP